VLYRVLGEERGDRGCVVIVSPSSHALPIARSFWVIGGAATASFRSAKAGKAKLIANPTRAISKRVFIVSSDRFRNDCRLSTRFGISGL
jgi:hypothetical protein